jgi:hypothetical protein
VYRLVDYQNKTIIRTKRRNKTTSARHWRQKLQRFFAMQPENMPQVREDLERRKLQRVLSDWLVAAQELRMEK